MPMENELPKRRRSWFRFSLRSLMLVTLLASVYLAGRFGAGLPAGKLAGQWQAELPAGFQRPVTLKHLEDNRFLLSSGGSVFNGIYEWEDGQLTVVDPSDQRMSGLAWRWDGKRLLLIDEPKGTPTGSSYLGTTLVRVPPAD